MASIILFIGVSIIFNGYFIGRAISAANIQKSNTYSFGNNKVLNLTQVAEYLNMPEEKVKGIIETERIKLNETGSFSGIMFPYFTVDNEQYFYKDQIDEWLKEIAGNRREYNTIERWIL
jgi:hypothetical protein